MATPLAFENKAKDVVHLFVMKDDCPLGTAFIPLSEVKENEPQNWTLKGKKEDIFDAIFYGRNYKKESFLGPNGENMDEIAIQAKFKYDNQASLDSIMQMKLTNHLIKLGRSLFENYGDGKDDLIEVTDEHSKKMKLGVLIREHRSKSARYCITF